MKYILFALSVLIITFCSNGSVDTGSVNQKHSKLFIKTTIVERNSPLDSISRTDTISAIHSNYFQVRLSAMTDSKKGYIADKKILNPTSSEKFKMIFFHVVNEQGEDYNFKTSTEFLNFMIERGYEMVEQLPDKYGAEYTFKRK